MVVLKNIVVATDFSEPSAVALAYGRDLARAYEATLHVLHIVEDVLIRYSPEVGMVPPDMQDRLEANARRDLEALISDDDRRTLKIVPRVEGRGSISRGITDYAKEHRIDLIIVGTHGRKALGHFLLGSVAERVIRTAGCPVLTVRSPERDFNAPDAMTVTERQSAQHQK